MKKKLKLISYVVITGITIIILCVFIKHVLKNTVSENNYAKCIKASDHMLVTNYYRDNNIKNDEIIITGLLYNPTDTEIGYYELYENRLKVIFVEFGISFCLPKSWYNNVRFNVGDKSITVLFWGKSKEGKKERNGSSYGISAFYILYEDDNVVYDWKDEGEFVFLGIAHNKTFYVVDRFNAELSLVQMEINDYEKGKSIYQRDINQYDLMKTDAMVINTLVNDFAGFDMSFEEIELD